MTSLRETELRLGEEAAFAIFSLRRAKGAKRGKIAERKKSRKEEVRT